MFELFNIYKIDITACKVNLLPHIVKLAFVMLSYSTMINEYIFEFDIIIINPIYPQFYL